MSSGYRFKMEERVRVEFPRSKRYPRGRVEEGVVAHRRTLPGFENGRRTLRRYTVLFDNDQVETLIPEYWLSPVDQMELTHG